MKFFALFIGFFRDLVANRFVIFQLTKRDYKNRYIGSFLGFLWTVIQPMTMIFVLWFVFVKGFKAGPVAGNIPFISYLALGMIAWDFFSQTLTSSTNVFQEYSYLVKKINFRVAVLPVVKLLSSLLFHGIFVLIAVAIVLLNGGEFSIFWLQIFYYLFAMMVLTLGLSWLTSSLQVFVKDISQLVTIVLQFGFWLTPVVWDFSILSEKYAFWFSLNPMFHIVEGYRNSFIFNKPFWEDVNSLLFFWGFTLLILILGVFVFRKSRPHFADVL